MSKTNGRNGKQKIPKKNFFKEERVRDARNRKLTVERDKRCRSCEGRDTLSAHHIIFKGEGGDDKLENLITLCFTCHRHAHDGVWIGAGEGNKDIFMSPKVFMMGVIKRINDKLYEQTLLRLEKKP